MPRSYHGPLFACNMRSNSDLIRVTIFKTIAKKFSRIFVVVHLSALGCYSATCLELVIMEDTLTQKCRTSCDCGTQLRQFSEEGLQLGFSIFM